MPKFKFTGTEVNELDITEIEADSLEEAKAEYHRIWENGGTDVMSGGLEMEILEMEQTVPINNEWKYVYEIADQLWVGKTVDILFEQSNKCLEDAYIGDTWLGNIYLWHNDPHFDGVMGNMDPKSGGYKYSWGISKNSRDKILIKPPKPLKKLNNKPMNTKNNDNLIKDSFKTPEQRAMEHFGLVNADGSLNGTGRKNFQDFIYMTGSTDKDEFVKKVMDEYTKDTKK